MYSHILALLSHASHPNRYVYRSGGQCTCVPSPRVVNCGGRHLGGSGSEEKAARKQKRYQITRASLWYYNSVLVY